MCPTPNVQDGSQAYVLHTDDVARHNLDIQHQLIANESYQQLQKAGLQEGQIVWDIGCGSGAMTEYLAQKVGSTGQVFAVDASKEQLSHTQKRLTEAGFKNVTFILSNIQEANDWPVNQADIVYSRFILMHLTDPQEALIQMKALLKPGAVLSLQESTFSTHHTSDHNPIIKDYYETLLKLGLYNQADYDIGKKLAGFCKALGFAKIEAYEFEYRYNAKEAKLVLIPRIDEVSERMIATGLADDQKINEWKRTMRAFPEQDATFYFSSTQNYVLAWKKD